MSAAGLVPAMAVAMKTGLGELTDQRLSLPGYYASSPPRSWRLMGTTTNNNGKDLTRIGIPVACRPPWKYGHSGTVERTATADNTHRASELKTGP